MPRDAGTADGGWWHRPRPDTPPHIKRNTLLLLFISLVLLGIALILAAQLLEAGILRDLAIALGIGLVPTGGVSIMQSFFTDAISQHETRTAIKAEIQEGLERSEPLLNDCSQLGVEHVFRTRFEALKAFAPYIRQEIDRARRGEEARLWFVCTSLRGFFFQSGGGFSPRDLIRDAAAEERLSLRILMTQPDWARAREIQENRPEGRIRWEIEDEARRLTDDFHVNHEDIRFYAGSATVFAIATTEHMLLNPYPYQTEAQNCFSILVHRVERGRADREPTDIYGQYLKHHFERAWECATLDGAGTAVGASHLTAGGRLRVSENQDVVNEMLRREILKEPPDRADLLEFSANTVRPLIRDLCEQGADLRILVKHPDTVGADQRGRILGNLRNLERFVLGKYKGDVQIRCYRPWASLRGRRLGSTLVNVGWYTPDLDEAGQVTDVEVVGDTNPLVTGDLRTAEGKQLQRMFDELFAVLWKSAEKDDAMEILHRVRASERDRT